jgi:glycosyltransferase 2 family protein
LRRAVARLQATSFVQSKPVAAKIGAYADGVFESLQVVVGAPSLVALLVCSAGVWLFEGGIFFFVAKSLGITASAIAAWIAMTLASLSTLIPSSPGYVGPYHYFAILGMTTFGVSHPQAAAFAVLSHAILYLMITLWGGGLLLAAGGTSRLRSASRLSPANGD